MKEVKLIKFSTMDILVGDHCEETYIHKYDAKDTNIINSSEYVPSFVETENLIIRKVVDHGVDHYIAVTSEIWEYLYLIENPVTAKTQQATIDDLKDYKYDAMVTIEIKAMQYKRIVTASLWTRIKWLFTGVN